MLVCSAPVSENNCIGDLSPSDGDILSCDCHVRYLKHTTIVADDATPCHSPPELVDRRWDSIQEHELVCSQSGTE